MIPNISIHSHTSRGHADNTAEEMILSAIDMGCPAIGFSEHSYIDEYNWWTLERGTEMDYVREILALKEKYKGKIDVFLGLEQDCRSPMYEYDKYDYVIGSIHAIPYEDGTFSIDETREHFIAQTNARFGGDFYKVCEDYYDLMCNIVEITKCDIIGHFDIVTKFNEPEILDIEHPRYKAAYMKALDVLCKKDVIFEVNTGAISRGHRTSPYPSKPILKEMCRRGCKIIVTSDTHNKDTILCWFDKADGYLKDCGYKSVLVKTRDGFKEVNI